jgi:hypothetical protein
MRDRETVRNGGETRKEIERNEGETAWRNDETEGLEKNRVRAGRWLAETSDFSAKNPNFLVIRF